MATAKEITRMKLELNQVTRTKSILNQNQIQKLWNSTNVKYKYERPAKGGGTWTYVKGSYVRRVMDSVFGFNWDFDVETTLKEAFDVAVITKTCVVKGVLTGRVWFDGEWVSIRKTQFGRADVKFKKGTTDPLDFGNDMKAASTDAFKKAASMMGIASDVYEEGEFMEIEIVGSEENSDRSKLANKRLKAAKKAIGEEGEAVNEPKA